MAYTGLQYEEYEEGYEDEYEGYEEEYTLGGGGNQRGPQVGYGFQQSQPLGQAQPKYVRPQVAQRVPLQRRRPMPQPQMHPPPYQPQRQVPRQAGIPPRVPLGVPRRHNREVVRGVEAHFKPIITNNPSPVVIPQNHDGRTFEVRTNALQSLPKFKGLATEEPYFHLEAYDSICNTIGGQGFTADDVKLALFQFSLEDKAKRWFYTLPSASVYT